ncbi:M23 family metallopeptidase [Microbacteriaceae bacterium 4G12]
MSVLPGPARVAVPRRSPYRAVPATVLVHQPGRHRFALTGPLTVAAIACATTLALTSALPSYAVPESLEGDAIAVYDADAGAVQTLTVANATSRVITHDGYTVVAPPPPPPEPPQQVTGVSTGQPGAGADASGADGLDIRWPFASPSPISSGFGPRKAPCRGCSSNHRGLDFTPGNGTPIQAIAAGVVRSAVNSDSGLGVHVILEHELDGVTVTSTYAHMQFGSLPLRTGQVVAAGDLVGRVGNTGASTGAHLHLEIAVAGTPVDPRAWLTRFAG